MCKLRMRNRYRVHTHGDLEATVRKNGSLFYPSFRKTERSRTPAREENKGYHHRKSKSRRNRCSQKYLRERSTNIRSGGSVCDQPVLNGFGNKINNTNENCSKSKTLELYSECKTNNTDDFAWIFDDSTEDKETEIGDILSISTTTTSAEPTECLSQQGSLSTPLDFAPHMTRKAPKQIREAIEEEIKRKYAEIDALMEQLNSKRQKKRQRFSRRITIKSHNNDDTGSLPSPLIIHPIRRHRRLAQPIRNAVLMRSSMKKAWKGTFGSCCGMGCWATWKWVNMMGVLSDYA